MANLISGADGNLTAAATWRTTDPTALVEPATLGSTVLTVAVIDSAVFQPGAITVDGVAVRLASRAAGAPATTITLTLRNSTLGVDIASVTANVSDLAPCSTAGLEGGWYFFKFSAAFLLVVATNYVIRANLSAVTIAVSLATNNTANNWLHMLRTTTTAAPAAGDNMHVMGEFDGAANPATTSARAVTMDQTAATDYGSANVITNKSSSALGVNNRATLTWAVTAATAYQLRLSGNLNVFSGGTYNQGTNGAEVPRDGSALLAFDCAADSNFGLWGRNGSICNFYGLSRTSGKLQWKAKLSANHAIAATTINIDTDTGWLAGDEVGIAPTIQMLGVQYERRTLNANAGAASFVITAGLTYAHLGSGDYVAEVILLTRNVRVESVSTTAVSFFCFDASAVVVCSWMSFRYCGSTFSQVNAITTTAAGSLFFQYCVVQDSDGAGIKVLGATHGNWTIDRCALYNTSREGVTSSLTTALTTGTWTLTDVIILGFGGGSTAGAFYFSDVGGTISNLAACGGSANGIIWDEEAIEGGNGGTYSGTWVVHSATGVGLIIRSAVRDVTFPRTEFWRNAGGGLQVEGNLPLSNVEFNGGFWLANGSGNTPTGVRINWKSAVSDLRFRALDIAADTSYDSNWGILYDYGGTVAANIQYIDCRFSQTTGLRVPVTLADIGVIADSPPGTHLHQGIARNCSFGAPTPVSFYYAAGPTPIRNSKYSYVRCPLYNQTAGDHRTFTPRGTLAIEAATFDVTPGLKMSPLEALATPFDSNALIPGAGFLVPVLAGQTVTVSVKVRKSAGYNGSTEPQLVLLADAQLGVAADAVIDTLSVAAGNWETLTGTTAAAAADGVMEFVVRCYGTAGDVFVDSWSAA